MKIIHNPQKCIGCGTCASICPDFWQMADDGKAHLKEGQSESEQETLDVAEESCVQEVVDACPVQAVEIQP
jgi:ferredoxin